MLILNAGNSGFGFYQDQSEEEIENTFNLNGLSTAYIIKAMLNQLLNRDKRSAIVITSSVAATLVFPCGVPYCMSKTFVTYLAEGLNYELKDKIDVLSYNPGEVATKLVMREKHQTDAGAISVERASSSCFRDLGYSYYTNGAFRHELANYTMGCESMKGLLYKAILSQKDTITK